MGDGGLSTTIILATNRLVDCRTLVGLREQPLLSIALDPLRVTLRTPRDLPSGRSVVIEENVNHSADEEAVRAVRVIADAQSVGIFWDESPLVIATRLDPATVHLKIDLRHLGINLYDDVDGLHVGGNVLARNNLANCETAISLA